MNKHKRKSNSMAAWQQWYRDYVLFERLVAVETPLTLYDIKEQIKQTEQPPQGQLFQMETRLTMTTALQGRIERRLLNGETIAILDFVILPDVGSNRIEGEATLNPRHYMLFMGTTALVIGLFQSLFWILAFSGLAFLVWYQAYRARNHLISQLEATFAASSQVAGQKAKRQPDRLSAQRDGHSYTAENTRRKRSRDALADLISVPDYDDYDTGAIRTQHNE